MLTLMMVCPCSGIVYVTLGNSKLDLQWRGVGFILFSGEKKSMLAYTYIAYLFKYIYISVEKPRRIYSKLLIGSHRNGIRMKRT